MQKVGFLRTRLISKLSAFSCYSSLFQPPTCSTPLSSAVKGRPSTVTTNSSSGVSSVITLDENTQASRLPSRIRNQLCALLDTPCARGNDWRLLAQALTVDRLVFTTTCTFYRLDFSPFICIILVCPCWAQNW